MRPVLFFGGLCMSYEYNATSQRFDLPNPYRVQNVLVGITAAAAFLIGQIGRAHV
mgnify:CR=1 FL=1